MRILNNRLYARVLPFSGNLVRAQIAYWRESAGAWAIHRFEALSPDNLPMIKQMLAQQEGDVWFDGRTHKQAFRGKLSAVGIERAELVLTRWADEIDCNELPATLGPDWKTGHIDYLWRGEYEAIATESGRRQEGIYPVCASPIRFLRDRAEDTVKVDTNVFYFPEARH